MDQLTPEEASKGDFKPILAGIRWGHTYEYLWLKGTVTLPEEAQGRRVAMNLKTGGEAMLFVDGQAFGTYRADWVKEPHHFVVDNVLTAAGEADRR